MVKVICPLHAQKTKTKFLFECSPNNWAQKVSLRVVQCQKCDLIFFSPNLNPEIRKAYHNQDYYRATEKGCIGYPDYIEEEHLSAKIYFGRLLLSWFTRLRKNKDNLLDSIIDLGCASGHMLIPFRDKGFTTVGIDFSEWAVEWGKKHLDLDLRCQDMDQLRLGKNELFDCIIFWDSLEHVQKPRKLLKILYKHSTKDTLMIVQMPDVNQFKNDPTHPYWSLYQHSFHYTEKTLGRLLKLEGFQIHRKLPSSQSAEMLFIVTRQEK